MKKKTRLKTVDRSTPCIEKFLKEFDSHMRKTLNSYHKLMNATRHLRPEGKKGPVRKLDD